ncbi:vitamin K epoxide reductase family protein [Coleofasciculus sp. FACHB-64]|uniref:vitamin K epoxide reductase family protein n=1 Tax=Cyanophyceae TaxID=3028117 RepID=UPI001686CCFD|nr:MULTISPECIES: vitamin K epoxide reductase family protein [unclassified Coleofasciculus]MBD1841137.1 vitamin K epoxide reductase family protein [Coleofasciculus sp. FACHB-501]MBD1897361.1 vitamin K epoxide reductase family protein [Coleofasciculus sp. FACHB-129]MBD1945340.1 vitamin K epoxide reductase family protein [Coleofasciculus sp. FACHB-712]MBD2046708.1 vitamin K epoxide reductase family protein [Coleofasciculus sp. FACHB-64]MBD2539723.1 vitamin K epoxide reductase family protein [Cole
MEPQQLSQELRKGQNPHMSRRRAIIGLSMLGGSMGQLVTLYQTGIISHLPDPPGQTLFDADRVDASNYAYSRFNSPDGPIMVLTYAITAWLAAAGGLDRARRNPLLPIAMGIKILIDVVTNLELAREEWSENKAFCEYCQVATVCSLTSLVLAAPEVIAATRALLGQGDKNTADDAQ